MQNLPPIKEPTVNRAQLGQIKTLGL